MYELILSEWERIFARKKTIVSLLIYIVLLGLLAFGLHRGGIGFYTPEMYTQLNSLNFPVFLLKEVGFLLSFIILPMLFVDSFNGEYRSGAFRMVLIRPQPIMKLLLAKWVAMVSVVLVLLTITFLLGQIIGWLFFPTATNVSFYPDGESFSLWGSFGYSFLFYLLFFGIYLAYLGIASLISTVAPNAILSFFLTVATLLAMIYAPDQLRFFLRTGEEAFKIMNGSGKTEFLLMLFTVIFVTYSLGIRLWCRKDWI